MANKERILWVDNARGIAILLVVLGHVSIMPETIHKVIYAFHMPLFFILSGLFLDQRIVDIPFMSFLSKKAKTLMMPFFIFGIINFLFFYLLSCFSLSGTKSFDLIETMMDSLFFVRHSGKWFLCGLFFSQILLYFIYKCRLKPLVTTSILFVLGGIIILCNLLFPFAIDLSIFLSIFLVIGCLYKQFSPSIKKCNPLVYLIVLLLFFVPAYLLNEQVDLMNRKFGNMLLFFISSLSGSLLVCYLTPKNKNTILSFLGQNSLTIYCVQSMTLSVTTFIYNHFVSSVIADYCSPVVLTLLGVVEMTTAVLLCYPIILIVNNYYPWVIGKKRY